LPPDASLADQLHFGEPVVLLRAPYQLSFAYAGEDREWQSSWRDPNKLPTLIRLTVRDTSSGSTISTIASVRVQSAPQGDSSSGPLANQNGDQQPNSSGPSQQAGAGQGNAR
jgi:general secretion pathway protein J